MVGSQLQMNQHATVCNCRVKWFDRKKGFGFLRVDSAGVMCEDSEQDILLHCSVIVPFNRRYLPEESLVVCEVEQGERGRFVSRILELDPNLAPPDEEYGKDRVFRKITDDGSDEFLAAEVKWFSRVRGYGFLIVDTIEKDVFFHVELLREAGHDSVEPGQKCEVSLSQSNRGPLAKRIMLAHQATALPVA